MEVVWYFEALQMSHYSCYIQCVPQMGCLLVSSHSSVGVGCRSAMTACVSYFKSQVKPQVLLLSVASLWFRP